MAEPRFLTPADVAEVLNVSVRQVYALISRLELPAITVGGKGTYRIEAAKLEEFIADSYRQTQERMARGERASLDSEG